MNYIKVRSKFRPGSQEKISVVPWLELEIPYPIIDIYKYLEKNKDTGVSIFRTWFLTGNIKTGVIGWVEARGVDYAGSDERQLNLVPNVVKPGLEDTEEEFISKQTVKKPEEPKPSEPSGISFAL